MTSVTASMESPALSSTRDWWVMIKPGVLGLVVFTGAVGMWLAPVHLHPLLQLITVLAIAMGSASGAVFNMLYDRDIDAIMRRTQRRPLVVGSITVDDARVFGTLLGLCAVSLLGLATNWAAAALLGFAIFFYAVVYTRWLKRATPHNIVIGGAAGAFPPVIGWMAMTGSTPLLPWLLFAIIFIWTPPHFWALALFRNEDYRRANVPMLPVMAGQRATTWQMLIYTIALLPLTLSPLLLDARLGWLYGTCAALLSLRFIAYAWQVRRTQDEKLAMKMFGFSILYLTGIFATMLLDCLPF